MRLPPVLLATALLALACADGGDGGDAPCAGGQLDEAGGLCWQDPPADGSFEWQAGIDACDALVLGDRDDWRLPTRDELASLLGGCDDQVLAGEAGYCAPCADSARCAAMLGDDGGWYWSSTPRDSNYAWGAGFADGRIGYDYADEVLDVRCVRPAP